MHIQKHHLEIIVLAADDAEITAENIANAADIPPYRVRAELKRIGLENPTRPDALAFIAKRSPSASLLQANMHREKHMEYETLWKNMERRATPAKGRPSKLPNLEPSYCGHSVYLRELAEWAGMSVASLRAQMESLAYMHDKIEYCKDTLTLTVIGANDVAKALKLEKAE